MANVFAILTAIVLAAAAFIASKNKTKYEAEITARQDEEKRLAKSKARFDDLSKQFDQTSGERKTTEEAVAVLKEDEATQQKKNKVIEDDLSTKQATADGNAKKISEVEENLKEFGNIETLVADLKQLSEDLEQLTVEINSSEATLADLSSERTRTQGVISVYREKDSNYSGKRSFFSSTRIGSIFPAYGFVTLPIGNTSGVVSGSPLHVVRDGTVVAKLRVSSVEAGRAAAEIVPDSLAEDTVLMVGDRVIPDRESAAPAPAARPARTTPAPAETAPAIEDEPAEPAQADDEAPAEPAPADEAPVESTEDGDPF